jgi:uncharacterized damage-inducible protein DinB
MDLRYPVGKFSWPEEVSATDRERLIDIIAATPANLRAAVAGLSDSQLDTPYRPGGWTVRQVVHHVPDSHMNSYIRCRLALTESEPTIKPYHEGLWAELSDSKMPVEVSLTLLDALHERWVHLLRSLTDDDFASTFVHPGVGKTIRLDQNLALYAWHGRHHTAHITSLSERMGWRAAVSGA